MTDTNRGHASAPARRTWRRVVRVALALVAVSLGIYGIARDPDGFASALAAVGFPRAGAALILVAVGLLASAEAWRESVSVVAGRLARRPAHRLFFLSQLGKYLPGGIWTVLAQVDAARDHGLARSRMGIGALLFLAIHLLSGLVVAAALLPWAAPDAIDAYWWTLVAAPLFAVALVPPVLTRLVNLALRLLRRSPLPRPLRARDVAAPLLWMLPTWTLYGLAGLVIARPLADDASVLTLAAVTVGGFALAWVVGLVVVPAPAGLGARDVVLFVVMTPLLGVAGAVSFAILLRVVHTVGDLTLAAAVTTPTLRTTR